MFSAKVRDLPNNKERNMKDIKKTINCFLHIAPMLLDGPDILTPNLSGKVEYTINI